MQITPLFATQAQDSASGDRAEIAGDFDQFLMLLTTQLQNQDPLSPLDATEFTNQLVAFSEVEQSVKANENLENLIALQGASKAESAINLVGKKVDVLSEVFQHDGETSELFYQLEEPASGLAIQVYNSSGALVRTMTGDMSDGLNRFEWDGKDNDGDTLPEGLYAFRVIAARADESRIPAQIGQSVTVDQVRSSGGTLFATSDGFDFAVDQVVSVRQQEAI